LDLNQLYFDYQISLMRATSSARLRLIHGSNAAMTARSIERVHRASGAAALRHWEARYSSEDQQPVPADL
jgi:hypothetical protein